MQVSYFRLIDEAKLFNYNWKILKSKYLCPVVDLHDG